jgi:hypothetical protein
MEVIFFIVVYLFIFSNELFDYECKIRLNSVSIKIINLFINIISRPCVVSFHTRSAINYFEYTILRDHIFMT